MCDIQGKRVLIVEDNAADLAILATALQMQGAVVLRDPGSKDATTLMRQFLPLDLIILDIMLPRSRSGYEIFDEIQADEVLRDIPVVAVSSLDPATEIPKVQARGMLGFISKPINVRKFPRQLSTCIRGEQVWVTIR